MKIHQRKLRNKEDSIWYDGPIAEIDNVLLVATGGIKLKDKNGFYDGKARDGFVEPKNDKELHNRIKKGDIEVLMNNWFETVSENPSYDGIVLGTRKEGIELLDFIYRVEKRKNNENN